MSINNETRLVTTLLLDFSQYTKIDGVSTEMFIDPDSRKLFTAMVELREEGALIDAVSVSKQAGILLSKVSDYMDKVAPSSAMIAHDCAEIIATWQDNQIDLLLRIGVEGTPSERASEIKARLDDIVSRQVGGVEPFNKSVDKWLDNYAEWYDNNLPIGIATGYEDIDKRLKYKPGNLITIGARTSVGKTTFALNQAVRIAYGNKVGFISMEMSTTELIDKIMGIEKLITSSMLADRSSFTRNTAKVRELSSIPIMIESPLYNEAERIFNLARKMAYQGAKIVFIDYLQLMHHKGSFQNRNYEIGKITSSLKVLASELGIPIVVLSQLKRKDGNPQPVLSDLRDSGSIEQDSNIVIFLHQLVEGYEQNTALECLIAKNRGGAVGQCSLQFDKEISRILGGDVFHG